MENTYVVIMAGGVGSRFWPASRAHRPKQLLDLAGTGTAMVASTVERVRGALPYERIFIITGEIIADAIAKAVPNLPKKNILAEPVGRNTAPCIGWAALHIRNIDPKGVMAVMPSDHLVANTDAFLDKFRTAVDAAKSGAMVAFGITPRGPETGFGYIQMGEEIQKDIREVIRFVEKPNLETAKSYIASGDFAWNAGMFFFTADRILKEIETQMPKLKKGLDKIDAAIGADEMSVVEQVYPTLPSQSIDFGVMENAANMQCVPGEFGWFDMGSWDAAYDLAEKTEGDNVHRSEVISVESTGCFVQADDPKKMVALVNVNDLVVVDTGDALLICDRNKTQNVKAVVNQLKKQGKSELL